MLFDYIILLALMAPKPTPCEASPLPIIRSNPADNNNQLAWSPDPEFADLSSFGITQFSYGEDNLQIIPITEYPGVLSEQSPMGSAIKVSYPAGSINPGNSPQGGAEFYASPMEIKGASNVSLEYSVFFPEDFDFVKGGKLPGLYGGKPGCSGGDPAVDCFSTRMMWRTDGAGELYLYAPRDAQGPGVCSVGPKSVCTTDYGLSIGRGSFTFARNAWTKIRQDVWLNTPGVADGGFNVWVDDVLVLSVTEVYYRHGKGDVIKEEAVMPADWTTASTSSAEDQMVLVSMPQENKSANVNATAIVQQLLDKIPTIPLDIHTINSTAVLEALLNSLPAGPYTMTLTSSMQKRSLETSSDEQAMTDALVANLQKMMDDYQTSMKNKGGYLLLSPGTPSGNMTFGPILHSDSADASTMNNTSASSIIGITVNASTDGNQTLLSIPKLSNVTGSLVPALDGGSTLNLVCTVDCLNGTQLVNQGNGTFLIVSPGNETVAGDGTGLGNITSIPINATLSSYNETTGTYNLSFNSTTLDNSTITTEAGPSEMDSALRKLLNLINAENIKGQVISIKKRREITPLPPVGFEGIFFSTFFGGHTVDWASPVDQYTAFTGWKLTVNA